MMGNNKGKPLCLEGAKVRDPGDKRGKENVPPAPRPVNIPAQVEQQNQWPCTDSQNDKLSSSSSPEFLKLELSNTFGIDLNSSASYSSLEISAAPATEALLLLSQSEKCGMQEMAQEMLHLAVTCTNSKPADLYKDLNESPGIQIASQEKDQSKKRAQNQTNKASYKVLQPSKIPIYVGPGSKYWKINSCDTYSATISRIPRFTPTKEKSAK